MAVETWSRVRADLLAVSAVVSWGVSYALTKRALDEWQPFAFTATRFLAMAAMGVTVLARQRRLSVLIGPDGARFAVGGLLGFTLYQLGFVLGLERTSALSSTLLLATIPLFSLVFLRLGGVERVRSRQWLGVGVAVAGIALLVAGKAGPGLAHARRGDLLSLGAAASFALYGIVIKPLGERYPASTVLAGSLLVGSVPLLPLARFDAQRWEMLTLAAWAIWLYSVIVPVYLAYMWWAAAIASRGVGAIAPYVLLVPVVGGVIAVCWLGEPFTLVSAIGAILIVLGLAVGREWIPTLGSSARVSATGDHTSCPKPSTESASST
jgi:drug/metabolite transporter (DMT)-like permease